MSTWHCPHLLLSAVLRPTAVAPLLLVAPGVGRRRSISAARTALLRSNGGTDGHRDTLPLHEPFTAYCEDSVKAQMEIANQWIQ